MVHPNTEQLTEYWRARRGDNAMPRRMDIDPMAFHTLLPQTFIVGRTVQGAYPFRLVGGMIADAHQTDLRGQDLLSLWRQGDRWQLKSALEFARRRPEPVIVSADMLADGAPPLSVEILFAPLTGPEGEADRFLGHMQPLSPLSWLMGRPVRSLAIAAIARGEGEEAPSLRLAAVGGRLIA
ncbi:MAG: PAS domain-containing protein [Pseudomonadota bacterium]